MASHPGLLVQNRPRLLPEPSYAAAMGVQRFVADKLIKATVVGLVLVALASCGGSGATNDTADEGRGTPTVAPTTQSASDDSEPVQEPAAAVEVAAPRPTPMPTVAPTPIPLEPVVFNNDYSESIAPLFAEKCASCHNAQGPGAAHWQLDDAADLVATHEWISSVVQSQYMPPWPSSDLSLSFHDNRSLRADEIQAIADWSAAGAPLDVADSTVITASQGVVVLDADVEIGPHEPYQGSTEVVDDYRCFIYDLRLDEAAWLQGFEFVPDQTQIVHHAIGYLVPARGMERARQLSDQDDTGGWQCYGGSGLPDDGIFLGWAPGQLPTQFPDGSGLQAQPGDFIVLQIHYHFDTQAGPDKSTIRLDWADGNNLVPLDLGEYLGPAEIPCSSTESGPLCDRSAARANAYRLYGVEGVRADAINSICGVRPQDFAEMTDGIASSTCTLPARDFGEVVSVFGHLHEIGSSFRMTLNAGRPDERVLLDIPDWSFDWQYNYYPSETVVIGPGDDVTLDCTWDRARRKPELEPAYILWADGTNDEMCFATVTTRQLRDPGAVLGATGGTTLTEDVLAGLGPDTVSCLRDAGLPLDQELTRDVMDETIDVLFDCEDPQVIGELFADLIGENFGGFVAQPGIDCIADRLTDKETARSLLAFGLRDSTVAERTPTGELVGDCVQLSDAMEEFGLPVPENSKDCIDEAGRTLLVQATIDGELPDDQAFFEIIGPCMGGGG